MEELELKYLQGWKRELESELDSLRSGYEACENEISKLNVKHNVMKSIEDKRGVYENEFFQERLEKIERDRDKENDLKQFAQDKFNERANVLKALVQEIDVRLSTQ